jgi:hypothetical protein
MKLYLIAESDVSPNALRSTYNPDEVYVSKTPGETNMSHEPLERGWLGTTNDNDARALGVVDTDDPDWVDQLRNLALEGYDFDEAELREWITQGDEGDLALTASSHRISEGLTWDEESDDGDYWPSGRPGWVTLGTYDNDNGDLLEEVPSGASIPDDSDSWSEWGAAVLEAAGIPCDYQTHETHNRGTDGVDWEVLAVRESDEDRAREAIRAAVEVMQAEGVC